MKILTSSTQFSSRVVQMFNEFTPNQKRWFLENFTRELLGWMRGDYDGPMKTGNPELELSSTALDDLIHALWCIRKCWGTIQVPTLYRLTAVSKLPSSDTVVFRNRDQHKPLTSWSAVKLKTIVKRQKPAADSVDIRLTYNRPASKHILLEPDMLRKLAQTVLRNWDKFYDQFEARLSYNAELTARYNWKMISKRLRLFDEAEYLIYLNRGDSFKCTWEKL